MEEMIYMARSQESIEIFCSYAYKDEGHLRQLEKHLSALKRQGLISLWHNHQIQPGANWAKAIDTHLSTASIILLLISPDFIASDYCYGVEMKRALERHHANDARVIPLVVRPCDWQHLPVGQLLALPTDAKPISTWKPIDSGWKHVAAGLRQVIEDLSLPSVSTPATTFPSIWNVPYRHNPFFTGREDLLRLLRDKLTTAKAAALTQPQAISGLGGIGKTQVALEYAYRYREAYRFVFWVRAASRETLTSDFVTIANLLLLPEKGEQDQNQVIIAVKQWFTEHDEWLLILNDADDVAMVGDFLPSASKGHIILTSRAQAMGPLAQRIDVEKMGMVEGSLFLLHRAKMLAEDAFLDQVSEKNLAAAEAIVIEMDFLPLALDQAGAYIEEVGCSLATYLDLYRMHRKDLLQRRGQLPSDHPEPVATTWSLSFLKLEQTNPNTIDLLRFCAFLEPDAIPQDLLLQQCVADILKNTGGGLYFLEWGKHPPPPPRVQRWGADMFKFYQVIEELRKFSLIQQNPDTNTLSIHRLVQAVIKDTMERATQHQWAERTVQAINAVLPEEGVEYESYFWRKYLSQAQACAMLIQNYALTLGEAAHLLNRTAAYLQRHALYELAEPLYQQALHIWEQTLDLDHPDLASQLCKLANFYFGQGKYEQTKPLFQRALAICERVLGPDHPDTVAVRENYTNLPS